DHVGTRQNSRDNPSRRWRSTPRPPHAGRSCLPTPLLRAVFAARRPSVYTPYAPAWLGTPRVSAFRRDLGGSSPVPRRSAATSPSLLTDRLTTYDRSRS